MFWAEIKFCFSRALRIVGAAKPLPLGNVVRKHGTPESLTRRGTPFMVFDTEMYARKLASRNTGGQASKASNIGEV